MDYEQRTLICDLQDDFGGKKRVNRLIKAFEAYWAKLQHQQPGFPVDPVEQAFSHALRDWLVFHQAILIGEVVPLALDFVNHNPAHPDIPRYEHIVADEYQDLNRADQALIEAMATQASVTVVGDEDQSIYAFRHAHPEGIVDFPRSHPRTHDELLNECRRCPRRVVEIANSLITHNQRLAPKVLTPFAQNVEGEIYIVQHASIAEEIDTLAAFVEWYIQSHNGMPAGEALILADRRPIGNGIRDALNARAQNSHYGWSAQSFYFEDALDTALAAEGFSLLTLLANPEDRPALRHWLGAGAQDCRSNPYARLRQHCSQSSLSPRAALQALVAGTLALPYTGSLVVRFQALEQRLATLMPLGVADLVDTLFPDGNPDVASVRQAALLIVPTAQRPSELLDQLRSAIMQPELPGTQDNFIRIMSLHKSKGLTARLVVIAGCIAGIVPTIDYREPLAEQNRQWQEQRRLFYVGITRSTETLVLSGAVSIPFGLAKQMNVLTTAAGGTQASPFIAELGPTAPIAIAGADWLAQLGF